jgi:DNA-binding LacI/PurR family transcriptional regulator
MSLQTKPPTLHDVASLADVSYQTVSRVVNNSPHVSKKTRARVQKAIEQLGYQPNKAARSLITRHSQTLQIITSEGGLYKPVFSILTTAKRLGYHVALSLIEEPYKKEELRQLFDELNARIVDGFVFISPQLFVTSEDLFQLSQGRPFVQVGADPGSSTPSVVFDQVVGTQLALQHLYDLGHRRIAAITGPLTFSDARVRHETYLAFMQANGLPEGPVASGNFLFDGGYQGAKKLLDSGETFTAIFNANDHTALGALRALNERKILVPEDISLVGFDDETFACYLSPPLTTVRQDFHALGKQAVEYLVDLIKDPGIPIHQRVYYPQLIVRQSTRKIS